MLLRAGLLAIEGQSGLAPAATGGWEQADSPSPAPGKELLHHLAVSAEAGRVAAD
jgi:hypothetical protein